MKGPTLETLCNDPEACRVRIVSNGRCNGPPKAHNELFQICSARNDGRVVDQWISGTRVGTGTYAFLTGGGKKKKTMNIEWTIPREGVLWVGLGAEPMASEKEEAARRSASRART